MGKEKYVLVVIGKNIRLLILVDMLYIFWKISGYIWKYM